MVAYDRRCKGHKWTEPIALQGDALPGLQSFTTVSDADGPYHVRQHEMRGCYIAAVCTSAATGPGETVLVGMA